MLIIKNLCVSIDQKKILEDINLTIQDGSVHAIMGPNGSGKSSLALTCMGHPDYQITSGSTLLDNQNITDLSPDKRSKAGVFLAFQNPIEIPGLTVFHFLKELYSLHHQKNLSITEFQNFLYEKMNQLNLDISFAHRAINTGFSGGEKKRLELLQMMILKPKIAILDELDSGLDIDALNTVLQTVVKIRQEDPRLAFIIITHYPRLFSVIKPDAVHIMAGGRLIESGHANLVFEIEKKGYHAWSN